MTFKSRSTNSSVSGTAIKHMVLGAVVGAAVLIGAAGMVGCSNPASGKAGDSGNTGGGGLQEGVSWVDSGVVTAGMIKSFTNPYGTTSNVAFVYNNKIAKSKIVSVLWYDTASAVWADPGLYLKSDTAICYMKANVKYRIAGIY